MAPFQLTTKAFFLGRTVTSGIVLGVPDSDVLERGVLVYPGTDADFAIRESFGGILEKGRACFCNEMHS